MMFDQAAYQPERDNDIVCFFVEPALPGEFWTRRRPQTPVTGEGDTEVIATNEEENQRCSDTTV